MFSDERCQTVVPITVTLEAPVGVPEAREKERGGSNVTDCVTVASFRRPIVPNVHRRAPVPLLDLVNTELEETQTEFSVEEKPILDLEVARVSAVLRESIVIETLPVGDTPTRVTPVEMKEQAVPTPV